MNESLRSDAAATLAVQRELGSEYDQHLVDSFADRIEAEIERRSAAAGVQHSGKRDSRIGMYAITMVFGIPLTAIAAGTAHLPGLVVAWTGIAVTNIAYAVADRSKPRR